MSCHLGVADVEDAASKIFIVHESRLNETATSLVPPGNPFKIRDIEQGRALEIHQRTGVSLSRVSASFARDSGPGEITVLYTAEIRVRTTET